MEFEVGQIWSYQTRSKESASRLTILSKGIVHGETVFTVVIDALDVQASSAKNQKLTWKHLSLSQAALQQSIVAFVGHRAIQEGEDGQLAALGYHIVPTKTLLDELEDPDKSQGANCFVEGIVKAPAPHAGRLVDSVIKEYVAPFLKALGFRKDGGSFWRDSGNVVDVVTCEKSPWNQRHESSFTINVGLYWKDIQRDLGFFAGEEKPKAWDCLIRERIGFIVYGKDLWWTLTPDSEPETIGADVVEKLQTKALPWLTARRDLTTAMSHVARSCSDVYVDAFRAALDGRPITPLAEPVRKGFLLVDGKEYDMRTKESGKAYHREMKERPLLVSFHGYSTVYDLNTKEGRQAFKLFEETNKDKWTPKTTGACDGVPAAHDQ